MKHRLLSLLVALALLTTLLPVGALAADTAEDGTQTAEAQPDTTSDSAEQTPPAEPEETGFKASEGLIELIKKWEGFSKHPYEDYGQWTVGYGTRAPDEHLERYRTEGISEEEATELLAQFMNDMGQSVNSFIEKYGLEVTQGQFDAMLSLTYNCGGRWMTQTSTLRTAVLDGWTGSDYIFAWGQWSTAGGVTLPGLVRRRLSEANMYLNGVYDLTVPDNYCYVQFDANGGETEIVTQAYDSTEAPVKIRAVPTYENFVFKGWYTDPTGGEKVETLDASLKGYKLYAHWGAGSGAGQPQDKPGTAITGKPVSYTREVTSQVLSAFQEPVKGALVVDSYGIYELLTIEAEYTDSAGTLWGKVVGGGWVNLCYTQDPNAGDTADPVTVTVTGVDVNVRRGPGTAYAQVGTVTAGDKLVITRTTTGGGYTWGKFDRGWVALKYTDYDDVVNGTLDKDETPQEPVNGTVNVSEFLRIRSGPSTEYDLVGYLYPGDRVTILERKAVGGTIWGKIEQGWISLDYVILDETAPDGTAPDNTNPDDTTPDDTTPDDTTPDDTTPEDTTPDDTTPDGSKPENTTPEEPKPYGTGKVKLTSGTLNIRSGPSTGYTVLGVYENGAAVTIWEVQLTGTTEWGKTDRGWISMDFVQLDAAEPESPAPDDTTPDESEPETPPPEEKPADTTLFGTVILNSGYLRIRVAPGMTQTIVGNLRNGDRVQILERKTVSDVPWGRTAKGWICLNYVRLTNSEGAEVEASKPLTGTVNVNEFLRIRSGAGTYYSVAGYLRPNDRVTILERRAINGTVWGRIERGWISMDYIVLDDGSQQTPSQPSTQLGTVTGDSLRIRTAAGTGNRIVGLLNTGNRVSILQTTMVNGVIWGQISNGWICMDYVKLD